MIKRALIGSFQDFLNNIMLFRHCEDYIWCQSGIEGFVFVFLFLLFFLPEEVARAWRVYNQVVRENVGVLQQRTNPVAQHARIVL